MSGVRRLIIISNGVEQKLDWQVPSGVEVSQYFATPRQAELIVRILQLLPRQVEIILEYLEARKNEVSPKLV